MRVRYEYVGEYDPFLRCEAGAIAAVSEQARTVGTGELQEGE